MHQDWIDRDDLWTVAAGVDAPIKVRSPLDSRNITIAGHRTSLRLAPEFWALLETLAAERLCSIHDLATDLARAAPATGTTVTRAIEAGLLGWLVERAGMASVIASRIADRQRRHRPAAEGVTP